MAHDIKEVQEHIIDLDGVRYRLACVTCMPKPQGHDSWCFLCDGNDRAPADDPDRYRLFDEYCHGYRRPLHCEPHYGIVYKRIDPPNKERKCLGCGEMLPEDNFEEDGGYCASCI